MNPLSGLIDFVRGFLRNLLETEPARLIAWGGAGLLFLAGQALKLVGVELSPEVADAFTLIGGFLLIELIRRIVYAPATVKEIENANP